MHSSDAIVVSRYQPHHVVTDHLVFLVVYVVDSGYMQADAGEQALPARDWMRTDDWMDGSELVVLVEG